MVLCNSVLMGTTVLVGNNLDTGETCSTPQEFLELYCAGYLKCLWLVSF